MSVEATWSFDNSPARQGDRPIFEIDVVGETGPIEAQTTQSLADRLAGVFASKPRSTWVIVRTIPTTHYAENECIAPDHAPVFVRLPLRDLPPDSARAAQAAAITEAVSTALSRPIANIHVVYEPSARGRVAFGGHLVE